jgi:general secretion pathway protein A
MYLSHYNLIRKPFQITTDPKFLWLGKKHQEALAMLKHGVLHGKGFLLLTGDRGTGKTTLINALQRDLDSNIIAATVVDPNLEVLEFLAFLQTAFGIEAKLTNDFDFITHFAEFLNNANANDKKVLLIIDEAQRLSTELLEEIRVLSNIEKGNTKLLKILFVGQNEFAEGLTKKESRAIRERIEMTHEIKPLTENETTEYIKYRLKVAGTEEEIFTKKAIHGIYAFSGGNPRLINIICDHALLTGYVRGIKTINPPIVKACAKEITIPGETRLNPLQSQPLTAKQERKPLRRVALCACLLLVIAFCGYLFNALDHKDHVQDLKNHEEAYEEDLPEANRANSAMIEGGRGDTVVLRKKVTDAAGGNAPETVQGARNTEGDESLLSGDEKLIIPFGRNTIELQDKALGTLDRLAALMLQNVEREIVLKAYTDTIGSAAYNKNLSELRANAVKSYLVAKGISPLRIHAIGMGEENPLEPNTTPAGRLANRRVEIKWKSK